MCRSMKLKVHSKKPPEKTSENSTNDSDNEYEMLAKSRPGTNVT